MSWVRTGGFWRDVMRQTEDLIEAAKLGKLEDVKAVLDSNPELVNQRDTEGATALHYAAFGGHSDVVRFLVERGAEINARDTRFGATPAGWAIEYLREMGGFLGIELADFAHAIRRGDQEWTARFLSRFPKLRDEKDSNGIPFRDLAIQSGNSDIMRMVVETSAL